MIANVNSRSIGLLIIAVIGIFVAFNAGNWVAEENYSFLAPVIGGLLGLLVFFGIGGITYLMIPVGYDLTGQISILPLPFSVRQLIIITASCIFISGFIFKTHKKRSTFEIIDAWIWINIIYFATAFFRNPVGVAALGGSSRVGGKPYLDLILAIMAYIILSNFRISPRVATKLPGWILAISFVTSFVGGVAMFFPSLGPVLGKFYSDFLTMESIAGISQEGSGGGARLMFLTRFGGTLVLYVIAKTNPAELFKPNKHSQLLLYLSGIIMLLLSGFRNAIVGVILQTGLAAFLRDKFMGAVNIFFLFLMIATFGVLFSFMPIHLPLTFQRALSFLPGDWDIEAVESAEDSSEWRFQMWRTALTTDKYIHSKVFGDGFGYSRADYEAQLYALQTGGHAYSGDMARQESLMINGDFHSGPVTTIRYAGIVGLLLLFPLLYMYVSYAYRMISITKGSPFQVYAMFIGIPALIFPFAFIFIFGDYKNDFGATIASIGFMKMIVGSFYDYQKVKDVSLNNSH